VDILQIQAHLFVWRKKSYPRLMTILAHGLYSVGLPELALKRNDS
jgi:hypothetical protein